MACAGSGSGSIPPGEVTTVGAPPSTVSIEWHGDRGRHLLVAGVLFSFSLSCAWLLDRPALPAIGELGGVARAVAQIIISAAFVLFLGLAAATAWRGRGSIATLTFTAAELSARGLARRRTMTWAEVTSVGQVHRVIDDRARRAAYFPRVVERLLGERYEIRGDDAEVITVTTMMVGSANALRESRQEAIVRARRDGR